MKKRKMKKLDPCIVEFYDPTERDMFAMLLSRTIGGDNFWYKKQKSPKRYTFMFWATPKEKRILDRAWDKIVQTKWDDEVIDDFIEKR